MDDYTDLPGYGHLGDFACINMVMVYKWFVNEG